MYQRINSLRLHRVVCASPIRACLGVRRSKSDVVTGSFLPDRDARALAQTLGDEVALVQRAFTSPAAAVHYLNSKWVEASAAKAKAQNEVEKARAEASEKVQKALEEAGKATEMYNKAQEALNDVVDEKISLYFDLQRALDKYQIEAAEYYSIFRGPLSGQSLLELALRISYFELLVQVRVRLPKTSDVAYVEAKPIFDMTEMMQCLDDLSTIPRKERSDRLPFTWYLIDLCGTVSPSALLQEMYESMADIENCFLTYYYNLRRVDGMLSTVPEHHRDQARIALTSLMWKVERLRAIEDDY